MRRDGCGLTTIANECAAVAIEVPLVSLLPLLAIAVLYRYGLLASISAMFVWHLWVLPLGILPYDNGANGLVRDRLHHRAGNSGCPGGPRFLYEFVGAGAVQRKALRGLSCWN